MGSLENLESFIQTPTTKSFPSSCRRSGEEGGEKGKSVVINIS